MLIKCCVIQFNCINKTVLIENDFFTEVAVGFGFLIVF